MRISVFGMGYVGAVTSACLARLGHRVIGVDPAEQKLRFIREGKSPILEEGLDQLIAEAVSTGRFEVTDDAAVAVARSELSLICVGTPSLESGGLRVEYVERVAQQIGQAIRRKGEYHSVVLRSTVLPGTTQRIVVPILEQSTGGKSGQAFGISMHPEFLREGKSIWDFHNPPYTVVGTDSAEEFARVCAMYDGNGVSIGGDRLHCAIPTAEAIKYGCNLFHAVKITFANEMGLFCKRAGVDSREVMEILCQDRKLNISPSYLKPGFAFGGSCLPKDLRACTDLARKSDVSLPMLESLLVSNRMQVDRLIDRIRSHGRRKVSIMGISFKEATDDLRESPMVTLAELLIGKGYDLRIFDPNVHYAALHGSNKEYIDRELPHLKSLLGDGDAVLAHGEVLIFGHASDVYRALLPNVKQSQVVLDLVGMRAGLPSFDGQYDGLYW